MIGTVGSLLLLVSFVSFILSGVAYFQSARDAAGAPEWKRLGRGAWALGSGVILVASVLLFYLILRHQFQYAYVYQYSSLDLQSRYLFSAFWAGQEGSFLLWIVYTGVLGLTLMKTAKGWEAPVMAVVALCQVFLVSMIVGLKFGAFHIGSSPFALLAERFPDAPVFQANPNFVPADGNGLNDLLQNYWMMIHPPTLFVGFATILVPFAYAVSGMWKRRYAEWVRPALPWMLLASMVLGVGVALGGYWAYETLSFGGYWAWDPVENSSLVPWLVAVAALHTMLAQKKSGANYKASLVLTVSAFMMTIYSTFLTRSGILGDLSVHSFVDLGLSNQLLAWLLSVGVLGYGLFAYRYRDLPVRERASNMLSREFMIFSGAMLLTIAAGVIILGTSAPILGHVFRDNPSAVPVSFYNKWTLPLSVGFVFLAGLGQMFWWTKMSVENVNRMLLRPVILSVVSTVLVLAFTPFVEGTVGQAPAQAAGAAVEAGMFAGLGAIWSVYGMGLLLTLLLFAAFFALYGNLQVLWRIGRGNPKLAGGAIAHVGFALVIFGIITSGAFSDPLAHATGVQMGESRDNFVLERGQTRQVGDYRVTYADRQPTPEGYTSYRLDFVDGRGRAFTMNPVVYKSRKEQWIQHPDIQSYVEKDIFTAVSPSVMFVSDKDEAPGQVTLARGDSVLLAGGQYILRFTGFDLNVDKAVLPAEADISVAAALSVTDRRSGETRMLQPVYVILKDRSQRFVKAGLEDWGLDVAFTGMNVDNGQINLAVGGLAVDEEDWLVVQAYEKPFISVLWLGVLILSLGFGVALYRRISERRTKRKPALVAA